jgi:hypothetical protein
VATDAGASCSGRLGKGADEGAPDGADGRATTAGLDFFRKKTRPASARAARTTRIGSTAWLAVSGDVRFFGTFAVG